MKKIILNKVKDFLKDPEKILNNKLYIYKRTDYYSVQIYEDKDKNIKGFGFDLRLYDKYPQPECNCSINSENKTRELSVNINDYGNLIFDLTEEEVIEILYLFNNLYTLFEEKFTEKFGF